MAATRPLTITDVYERFVKGKKVKVEDWDYQVIPQNLTALKEKYDIKIDANTIIPEDKELINNLFHMTACKAQMLAMHIHVLSQRTLRHTLMTYFEYEALQNRSRSYTLSLTLSALADYLCADRSAMKREIRHLNEDGKLASKGRSITLL